MKILIVEDEKRTAEYLKSIIEIQDQRQVVAILDSIEETVDYLSRHQKKLDLIFLDIQISDGNSFEIFKHIDVVIPVIFCTAYEQYTLAAIKNNGIDYILKPYQAAEINSALDKYDRLVTSIRAKSAHKKLSVGDQKKVYQQKFISRYKQKSEVIDISAIALFSIEYDIVYAYTIENQRHALFKKLDYYESVCDPQMFFRVNRQMLINRSAVMSIQPALNRKVAIESDCGIRQAIVVSRLKVTRFKRWLENIS
jgi:DNA-binding LytR/AlgR family response regulator